MRLVGGCSPVFTEFGGGLYAVERALLWLSAGTTVFGKIAIPKAVIPPDLEEYAGEPVGPSLHDQQGVTGLRLRHLIAVP